jgi:hypothetical protein
LTDSSAAFLHAEKHQSNCSGNLLYFFVAGSGKVHVDNSQQASYTEAPELLQARRQNPRSFPKHSTCQQGQNSNMHLSSAKQWGTKQVWGMPPTFSHATKLY